MSDNFIKLNCTAATVGIIISWILLSVLSFVSHILDVVHISIIALFIMLVCVLILLFRRKMIDNDFFLSFFMAILCNFLVFSSFIIVFGYLYQGINIQIIYFYEYFLLFCFIIFHSFLSLVFVKIIFSVLNHFLSNFQVNNVVTKTEEGNL